MKTNAPLRIILVVNLIFSCQQQYVRKLCYTMHRQYNLFVRIIIHHIVNYPFDSPSTLARFYDYFLANAISVEYVTQLHLHKSMDIDMPPIHEMGMDFYIRFCRHNMM